MSSALAKRLQKLAPVQLVELDRIHAGKNDRKQFNQRELNELADSIAEHGLAQPIILRPHQGGLQIVAGERRYRAHRILHERGRLPEATIPAMVKELDDRAAHAIMLIENLARVDLNPMEEAEAYETELAAGTAIPQLVKMTGLSEGRIRERLLLLKLVDDAKHLVRTGAIAVGLAVQMAELDGNRQNIALRWLSHQPGTPTIADFREFCGGLLTQQLEDPMFNLDDFLQTQTLDLVKQRRNRYRVDERLPDFKIRGKLGESMDQYLADLQDSGDDYQRSAAAAISHLAHEFARKGWM